MQVIIEVTVYFIILKGNTEHKYTLFIESINGNMALHIFIIPSSLIWKILIYNGNIKTELHIVHMALDKPVPITKPRIALFFVLSF